MLKSVAEYCQTCTKQPDEGQKNGLCRQVAVYNRSFYYKLNIWNLRLLTFKTVACLKEVATNTDMTYNCFKFFGSATE